MAKKFNPAASKDILIRKLQFLQRHRVLLFVLAVAVIYGYVFWRISSFNSAQPSEAAITSQTTAIGASPHIDKTVVKQLQQLQDNSVSVKTLFDQTRNNPFQE